MEVCQQERGFAGTYMADDGVEDLMIADHEPGKCNRDGHVQTKLERLRVWWVHMHVAICCAPQDPCCEPSRHVCTSLMFVLYTAVAILSPTQQLFLRWTLSTRPRL